MFHPRCGPSPLLSSGVCPETLETRNTTQTGRERLPRCDHEPGYNKRHVRSANRAHVVIAGTLANSNSAHVENVTSLLSRVLRVMSAQAFSCYDR
jgi:hypothetical protein